MPPRSDGGTRRRSAPRRSRAPSRSFIAALRSLRLPSIDFAAFTGRAAFALRLAAIGVVILDVFLAASFFTNWTGALGREACAALARTAGGASLVPIAFTGYIATSIFTRRKIPHPIGQIAGAVMLFCCTALLLGLAGFTNDRPSIFPIFEPGAVGSFFAHWLYENTGPLGTTLIGFACGCLTLVFFGIISPFTRLIDASSRIADRFADFLDGLMHRPRARHLDAPQAREERAEAEDDAPDDEEDPFDDVGASLFDEVEEAKPPLNIQTVNGKHLYVNEPDEVIREKSRALLEKARALSAAKAERLAREAQEQMQEQERIQEQIQTQEATPTQVQTQVQEPAQEMREIERVEAPQDTPPRRGMLSTFFGQSVQEGTEDCAPSVEPAAAEGSQSEPEDLQPDDLHHDEDRAIASVAQEQPEEEAASDLPTPVDVVQVDEMEYDSSVRTKKGLFPPPIELYGDATDFDGGITQETARPWGDRIINSLAQFGIEAELAEILIGPTVIQFRIQPLPGVKVNKIVALANDLALALAVASLRIEAPIPSMPYVGIEIPNPKRRGITLRSVIENDAFKNSECALPLPMGVTINGDALVIGLETLPHMLIAGTTGSGKSVFVNACIVGLCSMRTPDELKMMLVDPKKVELAVYETLPHLLAPPITDPKKAVHALAWAVREMEDRYGRFAAAKVRNIASYNDAVCPKDRLPHIVIVIDELAELMMTAAKEVEEYICRLAQMARAVGIHLMLATQRPSVDVVTGLIKANVPSRVAFTLAQMNDSRTIIDMGGAEKLLGKGDMLFTYTQSPKPMRVQSPWIDEQAIMKWLAYLVNIFGEPQFTDIETQGDGQGGADDGAFDDPLFEEAVRTVMATGMASASGLQRRLSVGYTRAARLVDMMELAGIVGPTKGAKPRDILVDEEEAEDIISSIKEQRSW